MTTRFTLLAAMAVCLTAAAARGQDAPADPYAALAKWDLSQSRAPLAAIDAEIRKAAPADYAKIEEKLLPILRAEGTPPDARRVIARWLKLVGSPASVPALESLLADADLSHPARMALEAMPGDQAAAALRGALPKVQGKLLAGVIASIGARRDPEAVAALADLAKQDDPAVALAAIGALGEIGTQEAEAALEGLPVSERSAAVLARARVAVAGRLADSGNKDRAAEIYRALLGAGQPTAIRVASLHGLIGTLNPDQAAKLVVETIQADDAAMRAAAVAATIGAPDAALRGAVAAALPAMQPSGQAVLLGVLADQADVPAREPILKVLAASGDEAVRVAALGALVRHGEADDVAMLVRLAHGEPAAVAEAARTALERMGNPGVDQALVKQIATPDPADRAVVLAVLASRRVEAALPALAQLASGTDATLALEAAKALAVMGTNEQLATLGTVVTATSHADLRRAAQDAIRAIATRSADKEAAGRSLVAVLGQAGSPEARVAVIPLLVFTRGPEALAAVRKAAGDADPAVREAGFRALVAWPEVAAAADLIELARTAEKPSYAVLALRDGALRLANLKDAPMARRLEIFRQVLAVAKRPEEKKQAIAGLGDLPSVGALETLQKACEDPSLREEAAAATIRLARQLGPVYAKPAREALERIEAQASDEAVRAQAREALAALRNVGQSPEGFVVAWLLAGPFVEPGKGGAELFDFAFAPEKDPSAGEWRPAAATPNQGGLIEIDGILGRENDRAAYLKTEIDSSREQEALLELGSDDGVKVWVNGQEVFGNNAVRPASPGQDKVKIRLKQGVNTLMLKITQGGGEWRAYCRLRAADGGALTGVAVAPGAP